MLCVLSAKDALPFTFPSGYALRWPQRSLSQTSRRLFYLLPHSTVLQLQSHGLFLIPRQYSTAVIQALQLTAWNANPSCAASRLQHPRSASTRVRVPSRGKSQGHQGLSRGCRATHHMRCCMDSTWRNGCAGAQWATALVTVSPPHPTGASKWLFTSI